MNQTYPEYWPQYFTATILDWKHLLADNRYKDIIIDSFRFLVANKRIALNAFVIMSNHIHVIWQPLYGFTPADIQASYRRGWYAHNFPQANPSTHKRRGVVSDQPQTG